MTVRRSEAGGLEVEFAGGPLAPHSPEPATLT